jgi:hypothetical protein
MRVGICMHAGEDRCGKIAEALGAEAEDVYARGSIHSFSMANKPEAFLIKEVGHFPDVSDRSAPPPPSSNTPKATCSIPRQTCNLPQVL